MNPLGNSHLMGIYQDTQKSWKGRLSVCSPKNIHTEAFTLSFNIQYVPIVLLFLFPSVTKLPVEGNIEVFIVCDFMLE